MASNEQFQYHEKIEAFRDAINFTEASTGFGARLIEKDYYGLLVIFVIGKIIREG